MYKYVSVGKILNFHGIKGEAKVGFSKNRLDFFTGLKFVFANVNGKYEKLNIVSVRSNNKFLFVKFEQINSIEDLLPYKGCLLFVEEETIRNNLADEEYLIDELVGMAVIDKETNKSLGFVIGVSNNGTSDFLSVKTNSKKISLVPFVKAIVPDVKLKEKKIYINNIEGLLE